MDFIKKQHKIIRLEDVEFNRNGMKYQGNRDTDLIRKKLKPHYHDPN